MKLKYAFVFCLIGFIACKKKADPAPAPSTGATLTEDMKKAAVANYAAIVYASYEDSYQKALELKLAAEVFVNAPSAINFDAVKTAWFNARVPYEQTEPYRFYNGPIDDSIGPEPLINSWPLDEAYIDYTQNDTLSAIQNTGIINNLALYPSITKQVLQNLNTATGETEVSCGYHAIEFLLWGQDFYAYSAGHRPYTDYIVGGTAQNQARRTQYLLACIDLLIDNLKTMADAWSPASTTNYRASFVANTDASLKLLLTGMGSFAKGELAGQRMTVALTSHSQEDEHSCFSDNTDQDIKLSQLGIYNIYIGKYLRTDGTIIDGTGIDDLVKVQHSSDNDNMMAKLLDANNKTQAISRPFDQDIINSNPLGEQNVQAAINAIKAEADELVQVASSAFGITLIL